MKQDATTLAQMEACDELNALPAHEKEALYATFPRIRDCYCLIPPTASITM